VSGALYHGVVRHARSRPRTHRLAYRIFMALLDLDGLDRLDRSLRLFSRNRFNLISFHDRDHGDGSGALRPWVEGALREAGIEPDGGRIDLLAMPRVLGHAFNPLSLYFCRRRDGTLAAIVHQVNNTFGERHSYVIPVEDPGAPVIVQACAKRFYVSPFMDMDLTYDFRIAPPGEGVGVHIRVSDAGGLLMTASFDGERRPMTDAGLLRAWLGHPLLSLKVLGAIHWEALWIWLKGVGFRSRPPAPERPVTATLVRRPREAA
jgi:DUF1365 family protein